MNLLFLFMCLFFVENVCLMWIFVPGRSYLLSRSFISPCPMTNDSFEGDEGGGGEYFTSVQLLWAQS